MDTQTLAPASSSGSSLTYQNPVWHLYFADPFILRHQGSYYAYGTGATSREMDGRAFPLLRSYDLVNWEYLGGALRPIDNALLWDPAN